MARHYTKQEKVAAVVTATLSSNVAAEVATGIPESSIRRWRDDPELAKYIDNAREDLAEGTKLLAHRALERIAELLPHFEPKELVTTFAVMVDKMQLLNGGATARTESRDITGSLSDADLIAALREAEALTRATLEGTEEETADQST